MTAHTYTRIAAAALVAAAVLAPRGAWGRQPAEGAPAEGGAVAHALALAAEHEDSEVLPAAALVVSDVGVDDSDYPLETVPHGEGPFYQGPCDGACGGMCDECLTCLKPPRRRAVFYGQWLYLQATDTDLPYAYSRDGNVPMGPVGVVDPDYEPGFKVGFAIGLDERSSLGASYTFYESTAIDSIQIDAPDNIGSLVLHPNTASAASQYLFSDATYDIDFQFVDLEFRSALARDPCHWLRRFDIVGGLRYVHLEQESYTGHSLTGFTPTTLVTDIDFEGLGARVGLTGEKVFAGGLMVYCQGFASFVAGQFNADYLQRNEFNQPEAISSFHDDRVVSILEYELGFGWTSRNDGIRLTAGYYFAAWLNTLTTPDWIGAVQQDDFTDMDELLSFSGLTTRLEVRW